MTKEQVLEMVTMRVNGATLKEIGERFGVSKEYVRQCMPPVMCGTNKREFAVDRIIYPALKEYMKERGLSLNGFSRLVNMYPQTAKNVLLGKNDPQKRIIDSILSATGLTYEQAFKVDD